MSPGVRCSSPPGAGLDYVVSIRPRTVLTVAFVLLGVAALVQVVLMSERVLVWIFVSLLLAMALNPAVEAFQRRGAMKRGGAAAIVYLMVMTVIAGIGALIIPTLVQQVSDFIQAVPGYVKELTAGRGPLGFLEREYDVVDRVEKAVAGNEAAAESLAGGANAALDVGRSVLTFVAGVVTITFLTLFMLLEGPSWVTRAITLLPGGRRRLARTIADDIYHMIGRYVTGNLLISLIAGTTTTIVLLALGVPYALAGATLAAILVTLVAFTDSTTAGVIVLVFMVVYQQLENHLIQPLVYGRTIALSPLAILVSVLIGAQVAGIIGALVAIPIGGTIQIVISHWLEHRRALEGDGDDPAPPESEPEPGPEPEHAPKKRAIGARGTAPAR